MPDYSQIAFDLAPDNSELVIFFAGQRKGTAPIVVAPDTPILNEDGTPMLDENGNPILTE